MTRLDLIKLYNETTEPDGLAGMRYALRRDKPEIICEVLPRVDAGALTELLRPLGYRFFALTDKGPQSRPAVQPDGAWPNWHFSTASAAA